MNEHAHWRRVRELFREVQQVADADRAHWLTRACAGDSDLHAAVLGLLRAQGAGGGILDDIAMSALRQMRTDEGDSSLAGQRIGAWRILRLLGEGGMGSVYLAERDDGGFVQRVALKRVRADIGGEDARARFLHERNLLARLSHPHVAQLHDGGVADDGAPYFTLEYVEGTPITRYCDERRLDVRARLRLVLQVCAAVAYAHRNLIVHRDLKPSNILVTADGETKLLDFGIAKLLDQQPDAARTATFARMMTPEYAAPEQVLGEPVTTATDVYAIGLLVYELSSGRLPYARAQAGTIGWAKAAIEEPAEALPRALDRVSGNSPVRTAQALAADRASSVTALRRRLRGDLDRVVQRALAKEPEARYPSVAVLAHDLQACIDGRAISGAQFGYRWAKFARRHWLPLAATAAIALTLIASGAALVWQARQTVHQARTTLAVKDFLYGLFSAVDPRIAKGRQVSARELLDRGAQRIERNDALDAAQKAELEGALGRIYYQLGLYEPADALQRKAIDAVANDPAEALPLARLQAEHADTLDGLGDLKGAAALADEALDRLESLPDVSDDDRVKVLQIRARIAVDSRDFTVALRHATAALAIARRMHLQTNQFFRVLLTAGGANWGLANYREAESLFREALAFAERDAGPDDLDVAQARTNLAIVLNSQARYAESVVLDEQVLATEDKVLGADHPTAMTARRDLGLAEFQLGEYAKARAEFEHVLAAQRKKLGDTHPSIGGTEINLGLVLTEIGDLPAAERTLAESAAIFEKAFGHLHQGARVARGNLAVVHMLEGQLERADIELTDIAAEEALPEINEHDRYTTMFRLGDVKRRRGEVDAAIALHRRALAESTAKNGEASRFTAMAHYQLALSLRDHGEPADAERELRSALASYAAYLPEAAHPLAATARYELAMLLQREGRTDEARTLFDQAVRLRERFLGQDHPLTRKAREALHATDSPAARRT